MLAVMFILVAFAVVAVGSNLTQYVRTEASDGEELDYNAIARGHRILRNGSNLLVKIFPFSAIKITVVVFEIITQVCLLMFHIL